MKKYLVIFVITLLAFQVSNCQETEEESGLIFEETLFEGDESAFNNEFEELGDELGEEIENEAVEEVNTEDWTVLDVDELEADDERPKIYAFGAQYIVAEKIGNHEISDSVWIPSVLHNLASKKVQGYVDYKFNVTLQDVSNPDDTFLAEYVVRTGNLFYIRSRVTSYTTYITGTYQDNDGNSVERVMKQSNQYGNDSSIVQFVAPGTFEPTSDPAVINYWTNVEWEEYQKDQTLIDWGRNATTFALQKALDEGTIEGNNWVIGSSFPSYLPEYGGKVYYRYSFNLNDDSNFLLAKGDAFVTKDSEGNWEILTSGIGSIEIQTA